MFFVTTIEATKLIVYDTDDGSLEVTRTQDFCRYVARTGTLIDVHFWEEYKEIGDNIPISDDLRQSLRDGNIPPTSDKCCDIYTFKHPLLYGVVALESYNGNWILSSMSGLCYGIWQGYTEVFRLFDKFFFGGDCYIDVIEEYPISDTLCFDGGYLIVTSNNGNHDVRYANSAVCIDGILYATDEQVTEALLELGNKRLIKELKPLLSTGVKKRLMLAM